MSFTGFLKKNISAIQICQNILYALQIQVHLNFCRTIYHLSGHRLQLFFLKKSAVFTFSYRKAYSKLSNLTLPQNRSWSSYKGSSFERTVIGKSPRCYIISFLEIGQLVPEKKIFDFFTIYGLGGYLGHAIQMPVAAPHKNWL